MRPNARTGESVDPPVDALRERAPLLALIADPGVGRVEDLADEQEVVSPEAPVGLPAGLVLVEPLHGDVVSRSSLAVLVGPDARADAADSDLVNGFCCCHGGFSFLVSGALVRSQ